MPVVLALVAWPLVGEATGLFVAAGVVMAASLGWGRHNEVAFDGTALWLHVAAAVPGWADRLGRALGTAVWAVPDVALVTGVSTWAAGGRALAPAAAGTAVGVLLAGLAVAALLSSALPYPVPAAGDNPFTTRQGAVGVGLVAQAVAITVSGVVMTPLVAALVLAWSVPAAIWPVALVAPVLGAALLAGGVVAGGRVHDRRARRVLARL